MIFYSVLISYAFVNVLTININDYTTLVDITNGFIEGACDTKIENETICGFECTIRSIVRGGNFSLEEMNFILAVPELADPDNLEPYMSYQKKMQDEITRITGLVKPPATRGLTLELLGDKIRENTRKAIWNLIFDDIMLPKYDSHNKVEDYTVWQKCLLIGLALSCIDPSKYTKEVHIENGTICAIDDIKNNTRKYKEDQNEFWEVKCDDIEKEKGRLFDQLEIEP